MEGDTTVTEGPTYEEKLKFVSVIAKPMASKKLTKKIYKVCQQLSHRDYARSCIIMTTPPHVSS